MSKILIFAGTIEGRALAEYLSGFDIAIHVCVATEYGEKLLPKGADIIITAKRLDTAAMKELMLNAEISVVVDATHPYAVQVTKNISQACAETNTDYLRLLRDSIVDQADNCIHIDSVEAAVRYLENTAGKVLLTTGSKELSKFTELTDYKSRLYARVLSTPKVVEECAKLGFEGKNLICMQGPFSKELNVAILKQIDAEYLVTKESGSAGGFAEKLEAAAQAGVKVIVIGRPLKEEGVTYNECLAILMKRFELKAKKKKITLLGMGMGAYENMTIEGMTACSNADVLIGAKRIANTLTRFNKPVFVEYRADEICEFLRAHGEYRNIVVALSGDAGFYSGAAKLTAELKDYELEVLPGISSVVYMCSRLKTTWQDVKFVSTHGRYENLISAVKNNVKVFSLLGGECCVN
jgi:precorrin-6Y C5,15-methyltransferase (decarboxylating)